MGLLINFLLIGCVWLEFSSGDFVHEYLDEKLKQSKVEIAKFYAEESTPVEIKSYEVEREKLWDRILSKERPFMLNMNGRMFILESNRVMPVTNGVPLANETSALQDAAPISTNNTIKFVRSIGWKNVIYLLVCYETGVCKLYTGGDNLQLRHRQTMRHRGFPMDADFFILADQLYLVVADNLRQFSVPSVIYQWRGTYMDVFAEIKTTAAVSVATFNHKESVMIIFAQNDENLPEIGSAVYEFRKSSLEWIQFLPTISPSSIRHYNHAGFDFILFVNKLGPGNLFWWDGQELLNWLQLTWVNASSIVRITADNGETFFLLARENTVELHKVQSSTVFSLLYTMELKDNENVLDVEAQLNGSEMIVTLIVGNQPNNSFGFASWRLNIKEVPQALDKTMEDEIPSKCFVELIEILRERMIALDKAQASWPLLFDPTENLTITEPITLPDLIIDSASIDQLDLTENLNDTLMKAQGKVSDLNRRVDELVLASRNADVFNTSNSIVGEIHVGKDAVFEEFEIDYLDVGYLNGFRLSDVTFIENGENFTVPVKAEDLITKDIQIDSLCGIPLEYWALQNDTSKLIINLEANETELINDTVLLRSDVSSVALNVTTLNGVNVQDFFDHLFIRNRDQTINGNIVHKNVLRVSHLMTEELNGKSMNDYLTKETDQNLKEFYIETLQIDRLYADSINGVAVSEAARISKENIIKGKVSIGDLRVTEKLSSSGIIFPKVESVQVYSDVTIRGNVRIKRIDLEDETLALINNKKIELDSMPRSYWTKSSDQIIENDVAFENDLIIDRLDAERLNGFSEDEFLYTTVQEIPKKFRNLHFLDVYVNDSLLVDGKSISTFNAAAELLKIRDALHLEHLRVNNLFVKTFDGLSVDEILNHNGTLRFAGNQVFPFIRAKEVNARALNFDFLNNQSSAIAVKNMMRENGSLEFEHTSVPELRMQNVSVENINGMEVSVLTRLVNLSISDLKDLIIDGALTLENDLKVTQIGDDLAETYLKRMAVQDILITAEEALENLTVQNATLNLLNGWNVNNFFESFLSKSVDQFVSGTFAFDVITTGNSNSTFINGGNVSELIRTDEPLHFPGNVTFDDLSIDGDLIAETISEKDPDKWKDELLNMENFSELTVHGNVSWTYPLNDSSSFSHLIENAITNGTEQVIHGEIIFEDDVSISVLKGDSEIFNEAYDFISDAVVKGKAEKIGGKKLFKETLDVKMLTVSGNTNVSIINDVDIIKFNNSVVRNNQENDIRYSVTFLDEVTIGTLFVNSDVHDAPLDGLVLSTDTLPANVFFKHLVVLNDVTLKNLDTVEFDKFVKERITLDGEHEILFDTRFNGPIEVTGNATVKNINGISPSDYVLSGTNETQFVSGEKTFDKSVIVNKNVYAVLINNVDMLEQYKNGVRSDEDVEIFGRIIFDSHTKVHENVTASDLTNGMDAETFQHYANLGNNYFLRNLMKNESAIEAKIDRASKIAGTLRNVFLYVDNEQKLKIEAPNIKKVQPVYFEAVTKLNLYGEAKHATCGLPKNCTCPVQYTAELSNSECSIWKSNGTRIWNFHEFHGTFGVNVITNTVSSSQDCSLDEVGDEFTTISWMKLRMLETGETENVAAVIQNFPFKIPGFLRDAQVFLHDDTGFVILARSYDPSQMSHSVDTLVYKLNLQRNELSLHQNISTNEAMALKVFRIDHHHGVHLVIACFGEPSESFLYRFDPTTVEFVLLRKFTTKSRYAQSLTQEQDQFVFLDDFHMKSVNIYHYNHEFDNFYEYQTLFYKSRVTGIETFYADEFGHSDSFIVVTTEDGEFFIYEYMFAQKFRVRVHSTMHNLQTMLPFEYSGHRYIFAGTSANSTTLRIVEQGRLL